MRRVPPTHDRIIPEGRAKAVLPGFLLSGMLLSFLGPILPAWGHHLRWDYDVVGHLFLSLIAGLLFAVAIGPRLRRKAGLRTSAVMASMLAAGAILFLAAAPPANADLWHAAGLFPVGVAAGLLHGVLFEAGSADFRQRPAVTVNLSGAFFVLGALVATLLIAETFHAMTVPAILLLLGLIPAVIALYLSRQTFTREAQTFESPWPELMGQLLNPGALLFSLLLFFQFGNEWAVAGWLPLFLIQRLGVSPASALLITGLYWAALLAGRIGALWVLPRISHWKLLMGSGVAALFGCLVLFATNNLFGASIGAVSLGGGFAVIYPVLVGKIGSRFPSYHPGLFNGLFSFALTGGMLAPAHLGYLAEWYGIGVVMLLPVLGTFMVLLLTLLIWIESRFGSTQPEDDGLRA